MIGHISHGELHHTKIEGQKQPGWPRNSYISHLKKMQA